MRDNVVDSAGLHHYITVYYSRALIEDVNRQPHSRLTSPHPAFSRVLSFLLLGFIVYGTTVEAVHKHGNLVRGNVVAGAASVSNHETGNKLNTSLAGCGDCLICQLHQHFSTSLIAVRHDSAPLQTRLEISQSTSAILRTRTNAPRRGRAPPFTS